jgi:FkbH-like protein
MQADLSLLSVADDPLLVGLRWAARAVDPAHPLEPFIEVLQRHGPRCSLAAAREITRIAKRLVRRAEGDPWRLLTGLSEVNNLAAVQWLRVALLEALGAPSEALPILATLPDPEQSDGRAFRLLACARTMMAGDQMTLAASVLQDGIRCVSSYRVLQDATTLVDRLESAANLHLKREARIAVVGTTTLDLLAPALRTLCFAVGIRADVYVGAFNQYQQEILDPRSSLAAFGPDVVILAPHWWSLGLPHDDADPQATVDATMTMLCDLWRHCRDRWGAIVIQHNFEIPAVEPYGRLSQSLPGGRSRVLHRINQALWDAERQEHDVVIVDVDQAAAHYGKVRWNDPVLWYAAKQYPAVDAILPMLRHDVAALQAIWGLNAKCLALDLDNTLWGGVIGEDGIAGIELGGTGVGEAYSAFQSFVQGLGRRGVVLSVCTKNNPEDVQQVFRNHPEMVLTQEDIALFEVSWRPKDESLRRIAEVLNISLDSIVFVDDSPQERAWVRQRLPEVIVPELPADPALFIQALASGLHFETLRITDEDRQRTRAYRDNAQRSEMEASSASIDDFLQSLSISIELRPFDDVDMPRIVQLINKTNQFNLTTRRRSEADIRSLMAVPSVYTQAVRVTDRFGENGLTGLLIAREEEQRFIIDTWLLSCRVMGRRIEDVMLGSLLRKAQARGITAVIGELIVTAKNAAVHDLYDRLGFTLIDQYPNGDRRFQRWLTADDLSLPPFFRVNDLTI